MKYINNVGVASPLYSSLILYYACAIVYLHFASFPVWIFCEHFHILSFLVLYVLVCCILAPFNLVLHAHLAYLHSIAHPHYIVLSISNAMHSLYILKWNLKWFYFFNLFLRQLGLIENNILNYDFDLVASDPSDANTNSATFLSDDTDDKSKRSNNPEAGISIQQEQAEISIQQEVNVKKNSTC